MPNTIGCVPAASPFLFLPLLGSLPAALAGALAAHAEQAWFGAALVADIDDHALTLTAIHAEAGTAQLLETRVFPHLGLRVWKERLLNALADCCVRQSRRGQNNGVRLGF